jgi:hypothetical protein
MKVKANRDTQGYRFGNDSPHLVKKGDVGEVLWNHSKDQFVVEIDDVTLLVSREAFFEVIPQPNKDFLEILTEAEALVVLEVVTQVYKDGNLFEWFRNIIDDQSEGLESLFLRIVNHMEHK